MRYSLAGLVLFLSLVACTPKSENTPPPDSVLTLSTESCERFQNRLKSNFKNVPGSFADTIEVRENPADASSPMIKVFYYGRLVDGQVPVVFFNGGPASNSHSSYYILTREQDSDSAWSRIPFIFIDQRGTGCSSGYPQGRDLGILERLTHYGSRGIVEDAEAIRKKLGLEKWKIFGQSYGAFIVHRYMTLHPESIVSASAHAGVINSDPIFRLTGRIRSQNRVIEDYLNNYPSDREVLKTLSAALTPQYCFQSPKNKNYSVCGADLIDPLLSNLGFVDQWLTLHKQFNLLVKNKALNQARVQEFVNEYVFPPSEEGRSTGVANLVIAWSDRNVAFTDYDNCSKVYANLSAQGEKPETWLFNECYASLQPGRPAESYPLRDLIKSQIRQDLLTVQAFKSSLQSNPGIPFYLYSGAKDAYVPVDVFSEELDAVRELVHYTHFLGTGHDGFYTEPQVWDDLVGYP